MTYQKVRKPIISDNQASLLRLVIIVGQSGMVIQEYTIYYLKILPQIVYAELDCTTHDFRLRRWMLEAIRSPIMQHHHIVCNGRVLLLVEGLY
jgi:hypothetical protein